MILLACLRSLSVGHFESLNVPAGPYELSLAFVVDEALLTHQPGKDVSYAFVSTAVCFPRRRNSWHRHQRPNASFKTGTRTTGIIYSKSLKSHTEHEQDTTQPRHHHPHQSLLGILVAPSNRIHSPFNMTFSTQCLTMAAKSSPLPGRFGNSSTRSRLLRTLSLICAVMLLSK